MSNPLFDKNFLKQLDAYQHKTTYVRIISLDMNDAPIESIEGTATGGSINIDGSSAIRRTCNISMAAPSGTSITDYHWAFKHKFKVEIGLANFIDTRYPEIIWFPQGVFIVNSFNKTEGVDSLNINISGQDKMCRLNGSMGGKLPVEVDFAHIDKVQKDGTIITENVLLYDTILMAVHEYGQEPKSNIIINDLDIQGLELQEYHGDIPLYLYYQPADPSGASNYGTTLSLSFGTHDNLVISAKEHGETEFSEKKISELSHYYQLNTLDNSINEQATSVKFNKTGSAPQEVKVIKLEAGDNAGYHQIPLIYPSELLVQPGKNIATEVLDKIKNLLGEYEYYYDLYGHFVFQKKKTYINELFSPINGDIIEPMMTLSPYSYEFSDTALFTNIAYNPQIENVKNDFVVWGKTASGAPIHVRYAIQKKPTYYRTCGEYDKETSKWVNQKTYIALESSETEEGAIRADWRELIYQMARDYHLYNQYADLYYQIDQNNTYEILDENQKPIEKVHRYPDGKTKYEQYYSDLYAFWRYLYDLEPEDNPERYYPYQEYYSNTSQIKPGWNKLIHLNPEGLIFWFDLLDVGNAPLNAVSVDAIGVRPWYENINGNSTICLAQTPEILFVFNNEELLEDKSTTSYSIMNISQDKKELFQNTAAGVSLIEKINELIYKHACCTEGVSLTSIPIYYLEPNTRIYVEGIGDLIINTIQYSLTYDGTMSLGCTKVVETIY